jgi:hypothetical protein
MHTVLETSVFIRAAKQAGLSDAEREAVVEYLAARRSRPILSCSAAGRWAASAMAFCSSSVMGPS